MTSFHFSCFWAQASVINDPKVPDSPIFFISYPTFEILEHKVLKQLILNHHDVRRVSLSLTVSLMRRHQSRCNANQTRNTHVTFTNDAGEDVVGVVKSHEVCIASEYVLLRTIVCLNTDLFLGVTLSMLLASQLTLFR